jgi:hypothetical protein
MLLQSTRIHRRASPAGGRKVLPVGPRLIRLRAVGDGGGAATEDKKLKETLADLDALLGIQEEPSTSGQKVRCITPARACAPVAGPASGLSGQRERSHGVASHACDKAPRGQPAPP